MQTWDYAPCPPYFRRMEHCLAAEPGDDFEAPPAPVLERGPATNPLFGAFFEAARQAGFELTDDVNGYRQEGSRRSTGTSTAAAGCRRRAPTCTR